MILFLQVRNPRRRGVEYLVQGHTSFKSWDTNSDNVALESMLLTIALGFLQMYLPRSSMCVNTNLEVCVCVCVYRALLFHLDLEITDLLI